MWRGTTFSALVENPQFPSKEKEEDGHGPSHMFTGILGSWLHEYIGISSTHSAGLTFAVIYGCTESHMKTAVRLLGNSDEAIARDPLLAVGIFAELQRLCAKVVMDDLVNKCNVVMYRLNGAGYGRRDVLTEDMPNSVVSQLAYHVVQRISRMQAELTILKRNIVTLLMRARLDGPNYTTEDTKKRIGGRLNDICIELEDMAERCQAELEAVTQMAEFVSGPYPLSNLECID
jgi:hypothetical protein